LDRDRIKDDRRRFCLSSETKTVLRLVTSVQASDDFDR
jgi:hypothetical protein